MAAQPRYPTTPPDGPEGFGAPCPTTRPLLRSTDESDWQLVTQEAREAAGALYVALQRCETLYHRYGDSFGELNRLSDAIMRTRRARLIMACIGDQAAMRAKQAREAATRQRLTPLWLVRARQEGEPW